MKSREVASIRLLRMKRNGGVIAQGIYSATVVILKRKFVISATSGNAICCQ